MSAIKVIRIALLKCDTPASVYLSHLKRCLTSISPQNPAVQAAFGDYLAIYTSWLKDALESFPARNQYQKVQLVIDGFDVVDKEEYPDLDEVVYDAVMMTGSREFASWLNWIVIDLSTQNIRLITIPYLGLEDSYLSYMM